MAQKFTAIFQPGNKVRHREHDWITEIFGSHIDNHIVDGEHKVVCDNAILFDAFIHANNPLYYEKFRGKNAFLVHFLDENYEGFYSLYRNFKGVYRNHWASVFNPRYVRALPLGYPTGFDRTLKVPLASQRPYLWSFAGSLNKSSRPDMAHAFATLEPHYLYITDGPPDFIMKPAAGSSVLSVSQIQRILLDSIFSPSPMGNVNIECWRTYEALECGSIPIVEHRQRLNYYRELLGPHPMPSVKSWSEARSLVADLATNPDQLDVLQTECTSWWARKKVQLRDEVSAFIEECSADMEVGEKQMFERRANSNLWRYTELIRHHDLRAARRRMTRMISRIVKGERLRVAAGAFEADQS